MRSFLLALFSFLLIFAFAMYSRSTGNRQAGVFALDSPTPYFHFTPQAKPRGRVLVVHGLDANKNMLNLLCFALADSGFEVFSIDLPGHGSSTVPFNVMKARDVVAQVLDRLGPDTVVIGHSMGATLLLDLANDRFMKAMVLFSPAPSPILQIQAGRVLLYEGQFDVPPVRIFMTELEQEIKGTEQGSVEFHDLPWTGHSGAPAKPAVISAVAAWLGGDPAAIRTDLRLALLVLMLVSGLGLGITLLAGLRPVSVTALATPPVPATLVSYIAAAGIAAAILAFVHLTRWLHLFATDYLIGILFLAGAALSTNAFWPPSPLRGTPPRRGRLFGFSIAVLSAAFVIAIPGFLVLSQFTTVGLSPGRLWRFAAIVLLCLPLFLADEAFFRTLRPRWKAFCSMLLTRALIGAIAITAALLSNREGAFLILIVHLLIIFWMVLWLVGGMIYRRTGEPLAAALFISLVHAWFLAAVFVTT